jgi:hypothetical protein
MLVEKISMSRNFNDVILRMPFQVKVFQGGIVQNDGYFSR